MPALPPQLTRCAQQNLNIVILPPSPPLHPASDHESDAVRTHIPHTSVQPYHPGNGSHGQLFRPFRRHQLKELCMAATVYVIWLCTPVMVLAIPRSCVVWPLLWDVPFSFNIWNMFRNDSISSLFNKRLPPLQFECDFVNERLNYGSAFILISVAMLSFVFCYTVGSQNFILTRGYYCLLRRLFSRKQFKRDF